MVAKRVCIGSKSITVTQLAVSIVIVVFALVGGFFGILAAEDRWNQKPACETNAQKSAQLEQEFTAGMTQLFYQQNVRFEEQRVTMLYDQLAEAKTRQARAPNDPIIRDRVIYLQGEIQKAKENLQKLHEEKVSQ